MTPDEYRAKGFVCINGEWYAPNHRRVKAAVSSGDRREIAKLERASENATLAAAQAQNSNSKRFLVRVTSHRRRLLDEDNLCEKYHVDCLRYSGVISGDNPGKTKIEVTQKKVGRGEREYTLVEVFELTN